MPKTSDTIKSSPQRKQVIVDNAQLSVLVAGPANGAPIVLLHGMPAGAELWRTVLAKLSEAGYRVYAPDLPGYGLTHLSEDGDYSLASAAELVAAWLRQEGIGPVWLVGHDLGGGVAQILVVRHPELVERLTMGDTVAEDSWPVTPIRLFHLVAKAGLYPALAAARMVPNPYARRELRRAFADPAQLDAETAQRVFWDGKVTDPRGRREFAKHLAALDPGQTVEIAKHLKKIKVPVLLIWAKEDRFQPWETVGKRLEALLSNPDVVLIDDAGHFLQLERPEAYVEALLTWQYARRAI
jgi:pimeloyl-ACP methyl ester carboxylesterase